MGVKLHGFFYRLLYRLFGNDLSTEKGQYFADRIYLFYYPNGQRWLLGQIDDDNIPVGALMASYRFEHGQEIYEEGVRTASVQRPSTESG